MRVQPIRPLRLVLTVAAGVIALLCLGGVGMAVALYDNATTLTRAEPDATLDNYLREFLIERNEVTSESLECSDDAGLEPLRAFRADVESREEAFGVSIMISWGSLAVAPVGADRMVTTDITRSVANAQQAVQRWQFTLVDEDGWRVCDARRVG